MVSCSERRLAGLFNAVRPAAPIGELFETVRAVTGSDARFTWVPEEVLLAHGAAPFSEVPFWLPSVVQNGLRTDASRAVAEGLSFRPMVETVRDTWDWLGTGWDAAASVRAQKKLHVPAGMSPEREEALLAAARDSSTYEKGT